MSWESVKLGDISSGIQTGPFGSQLHQSDYTEDGTPVVMPKDLIGGKISEQSIARVGAEHVQRLQRHIIRNGDILYSRRGDVGRCAFATERETGWLCGTGCLRVTVNPRVADKKFVFYQLQQSSTIGWVEKHAVGATMLNLNTTILSNIPVFLPPIETQHRIADILSAYDDLIENNRKQIKLLEEVAQRLYKEWFVDLRFPGHEHTKIVDGVPEGWRSGILDNIVSETGKATQKENRQNYDYYLPIDCLPKKSIGYVDTNDIELAESSLVSFDKGDIIFGAMRPYFHKVVVARNKGLTRSTCFVLNSRSENMWGYVAMLLFDSATVEYATQISVGTTMPYVRWKDMKLMPVLIPTNQIAASFNVLIKPEINKIGLLANQISILGEARDRLLPKLMSGDVEV